MDGTHMDGTHMDGTMMDGTHMDGTMMHHDDDRDDMGVSQNFTAACATAWDNMPDDCEADDVYQMCHAALECPMHAKAIKDACGQDFFPMPFAHINVGDFAGQRAEFCESDCPRLMDALKASCDLEVSDNPCQPDCFTAFDAVNMTCGQNPWISMRGENLVEGTFYSTEGSMAYRMQEMMCANDGQCMQAMQTMAPEADGTEGACDDEKMCTDECKGAYETLLGPECRGIMMMSMEMSGENMMMGQDGTMTGDDGTHMDGAMNEEVDERGGRRLDHHMNGTMMDGTHMDGSMNEEEMMAMMMDSMIQSVHGPMGFCAMMNPVCPGKRVMMSRRDAEMSNAMICE